MSFFSLSLLLFLFLFLPSSSFHSPFSFPFPPPPRQTGAHSRTGLGYIPRQDWGTFPDGTGMHSGTYLGEKVDLSLKTGDKFQR